MIATLHQQDNKTTRIVASQLLIRNEELSERADVAAGKTHNAINAIWLEILEVIKTASDPTTARVRVYRILQRIFPTLRTVVLAQLHDALDWGYEKTFKIFADHVPEHFWTVETTEIPVELREERAREAEQNDLFKPPTTDEARKIIHSGFRGRNWEQRLNKWSSQISDRERVAELIADGIGQKLSVEEISKQVEPFVGNLSSSAQRIVRTEYHRVANKSEEKVYQQFGDAIDGYQIVAIKDERTRPHHANRSGTIFWKPRTQKSPTTNQRPELPDEPNCRCTYVPVFGSEDLAKLVPGAPAMDTASYDAWFNSLPEDRQRAIVGPTRFNVVTDKVERNPRWTDFIDPESGKLLPASNIEDESLREFKRRTRGIERSLERRKKEIGKSFVSSVPTPVSRFGISADVARLQAQLQEEEHKLIELKMLRDQLTAIRTAKETIKNVTRQIRVVANRATGLRRRILYARKI